MRMRISRHRRHGLWTAFAAMAGMVLVLALGPAPARAQNFFDLLFGGFRRAAPPPPPPYAEPLSGDPDGPQSNDFGPATAFCVRTCDGRFFPIKAGNPATICGLLCPASPTKIFVGGRIEQAAASDGRSYREMPTAFLYRDKIVEGCTCNGKNALGLARINVKADPTLRPGDIVATDQGLMRASGRGSGFTPIGGETARRLSHIRIAPVYDSAADTAIPGQYSRP